jgi:site-specific DNA recombinase
LKNHFSRTFTQKLTFQDLTRASPIIRFDYGFIVPWVVENATKDQRVRAKELTTKRKTIQDLLTQVDKKAKNLIDVLSEGGPTGNRSGYLVKQVNDLDVQAKQLREEMVAVDFEIDELETKILSADIIKENFQVFRDVYDHLTIDEKYDLLHLLIKKVVYYEEPEADADGNREGEIKMDLWELPPIDPSKLTSAYDFAERNVWLPSADKSGHWNECLIL